MWHPDGALLVAGDGKSGANVEEAQARKYARLDPQGLVHASSVDLRGGTRPTVSVLYALVGGPVGMWFSEPIPDLQHFVVEMFDSTEPFRLWGVPIIEGGVAEVDAVNLHVGQRLRMDVGPSWMRVYLERGACGNTVARLISNLQHRFDSGLELSDPDLQARMLASALRAAALAEVAGPRASGRAARSGIRF